MLSAEAARAGGARTSCINVPSMCEMTVTTPSNGGAQSTINNNNNGDNDVSYVRSFQFDRVFDTDTTQQQMFESSGMISQLTGIKPIHANQWMNVE